MHADAVECGLPAVSRRLMLKLMLMLSWLLMLKANWLLMLMLMLTLALKLTRSVFRSSITAIDPFSCRSFGHCKENQAELTLLLIINTVNHYVGIIGNSCHAAEV